MTKLFEEFPERIKVGTKHADKFYTLVPDYYAVHYGGETWETSNAFMMLEEGIAVYKGKPDKSFDGSTSLTPVYILQQSGAFAVPTGKVYLRFSEGIEAKTQQQKIQSAGYEIVGIPPYAPHTAWVQSVSESIADSLSDINLLEMLSDVENVEPQMLMKRVERDD